MIGISPSKLAVTAAGIRPVGSQRAKKECRCAMCGTEIKVGELLDDFVTGAGFTDYPALACKPSKVICGDCKAVWRKEFMQKYSKAVISEEGIFPFAKMENQAYWLLNPPKTPFIMMVSDQQQQHLVWRCPVNYSSEIYQLRFGGSTMTIRRTVLLDALAAAQLLVRTFNEGKKKGEQIKNPFWRLDWNMLDLRHGLLRNDLASLQDDESMKAKDLLRSISSGEMWALCVLLAGKEPVRPDPVVTPSNGKSIFNAKGKTDE